MKPFLNKIRILFFLILMIESSSAFDVINPISIIKPEEAIIKAQSIVTNLGLNCVSDYPRLIQTFYQELYNVLAGVSRVALESAQILLYKKDYPNFCHVMTKNHLKMYKRSESVSEESKCSAKNPLGGCLLKKKIKHEQPVPTYYWPKYFIEVNEKGNDSHPAFSDGNLLYIANRKISSGLSKYVDTDSAIKLTSIVMGGKEALKLVGMEVGKNDFSQLTSSAILTPFEKMRVRSNAQKTNKSFDVNIWPVAMSELFATHFSVCGTHRIKKGLSPGGYSWNFKGIPMTCPVSMSNDAFAFWDTGMVDYLDPEAIAAMAAGSNPLTCGAAQALDAFANSSSHSGRKEGSQTEKISALSKVNSELSKSLIGCSMPILGAAHGIAKKAISYSDLNKWKQTKCTLWGSVAPRMSTSVYENDYSYANSALKFKMLSHELFGVPRGEKERWSLAYPWEGDNSFLPSKWKDFFNIFDDELKSLGLDKIDSKNDSGRSYNLYPVGAPQLVDLSSSPKLVVDKTINTAKELAYLSTVTASSVGAASAVRESFRRDHGEGFQTVNNAVDQYQNELSRGEDVTAHEKKEPIWQTVSYCHKKDKSGVLLGGKNISLNGEVLSFRRNISRASCLSERQVRGCLRVSRAKCRDANEVKSYYFERKEITGYKIKKHPVHKKYKDVCRFIKRKTHASKRRFGWRSKTTNDEYIDLHECQSELVTDTQEDTRDYIKRPSIDDPSTIAENSLAQDAIVSAAAATPWVAAELVRNKYSEMMGRNPTPGGRRVYTVWEQISCEPPTKVTTVKIGPSPEIRKYSSCEEAVKLEVYEYVQQELLRKMCDLMGEEEGRPWK